MPNTPTDRHRSRIAVAAVSGATAIAAFSATGWLAGAAARTAAETDQADQAQQDVAASTTGAKAATTTRPDRQRTVVLKQRPQRSHVTVRYVQGVPSAPVGTGGTVSQPAVQHAPAPAAHPAPQPAPHPAPAPPPAPSSGS